MKSLRPKVASNRKLPYYLSRQTESVRDHKFHSGYAHSSMDRGHFISHLRQTEE